MLNTREALEVLDRDFLETRGKILEIAAALDRIDRAPAHHRRAPRPPARPAPPGARGPAASPAPAAPRRSSCIFSLEYDPDWRERA